MQWVINGLADGLVIGLLAFAFMLVYSSTGVFFIALAGVYSLAPFVSVLLLRFGVPFIPACVLGASSSALLAGTLEAVNHWPLESRRVSWAGHLVTSLGLNMVIVQVISLAWGNTLQVLGKEATAVGMRLGQVIVSRSQLTELCFVPILFAVLHMWAKQTKSGVRLRGLASNSIALELTGTNVRAVRLMVFVLAGGVAAFASLMRAYDIGFDAVSGLNAVILAFAALVIGGKDNFWGGQLGGITLGIIRSSVAWFSSARWQEPVTFVVLALFLLLRPQGILGNQIRSGSRP
jgi:branched-chain amino acid transport system permease protein